MPNASLNNPAASKWPAQVSRTINIICFVALLSVMGTVIYGLVLRSIFERSYMGAVIVASLGAITILIGLAQQAIAARDAATWRDMAEWQIKAARDRIAQRQGVGDGAIDLLAGPDSTLYYEHLIEALLSDMQMFENGTATAENTQG